MPRTLIRSLLLTLLTLASVAGLGAELQAVEKVQLVATDWADGDSFRVRFPNGEEHTIRLYGADCFEWHVRDRTDARRLRGQRRYFGITGYGGNVAASITLAKTLGQKAAVRVQALLRQPFTVHTGFADGGGDGRYKRIYGFVTTAAGADLARTLVEEGLARAFGVNRSSPEGLTRDAYRESLRDAELAAAARRKGAWAFTDWDALPGERSLERNEEAEAKLATGRQHPDRIMDINTAARDELMRIPGIGEVTANAIIENRPYRAIDELGRVKGIGPKRLATMRRWVKIE